jgi:hypothetical protein
MSKRVVYLITPGVKTLSGRRMHTARVEYLPGYVKSFSSPDIPWILKEIEAALDARVPNLSGPITVEKLND